MTGTPVSDPPAAGDGSSAGGSGGGSAPDGGDGTEPTGFSLTLALMLPRDRLSVPLTRHLAGAAMSEVGVVEECAGDVELALTEACANVLDHSGPGDAYDVSFVLGPTLCEIRVVDRGHGFDHESLATDLVASEAERGRGIALMHALVDDVRFESRPERGTVVHLVKTLSFDDTAPARRLLLEASDAGGASGADGAASG